MERLKPRLESVINPLKTGTGDFGKQDEIKVTLILQPTQNTENTENA